MIAQSQIRELHWSGYFIVPKILSDAEISKLLEQIEMATAEDHQSAIKKQGKTYAARNLIDSMAYVRELVHVPQIVELLTATIGEDCGLVRALYFDKPSDSSWYLPMHKDLTIAVQDNSIATTHFSKPTRKAGVDHVEASESILENMLTLRIHLDPVTKSNGPLEVIPGSHLTGKAVLATDQPPIKILGDAGDLLVMRPMLSHASGHTDRQGNLRRRILHLEFSGDPQLPDGYQWQHFLPVG